MKQRNLIASKIDPLYCYMAQVWRKNKLLAVFIVKYTVIDDFGCFFKIKKIVTSLIYGSFAENKIYKN